MQQILGLRPGQSLSSGDSVISMNGTYRLNLQPDGNVVLYNRQNQAIWAANTVGTGGVRLVMQTDGNLVLYRGDKFPVWQTGTNGRTGANVQLQDDGNLVIYAPDGTPFWSSRTQGGHYHPENSWLEGAVATVGQPFVAVAHTVAQGADWIADAASQIPLVGPALHGVFVIAEGPFKFTDQVMQGERIDRALVNDLKDKISGVREVAPYAQTVISFVPGIGQGAAAALGAGLALAAGKSITEAIAAGVRGSIPGGAAAQAAFDLSYAAATGQNIIEAAGKTATMTLGLPPQAAQAFNVVYRAAKGDNIPLAVLDQARGYLPDDPQVKKAFDVGLALAHGKRLQDAAVQELANLAPAQIQMVKDAAKPLLDNSPALQQVKTLIADPLVQSGYTLGMGLMAHSGVNAQAVQLVRSKLPPETREGFDLGVAAYNGAVASKPAPAVTRTPNTLGGYVVMKGLLAHPDPVLKAKLLVSLAKDPQAQAGARYAIQEAQSQEGFFGWLKRMILG